MIRNYRSLLGSSFIDICRSKGHACSFDSCASARYTYFFFFRNLFHIERVNSVVIVRSRLGQSAPLFRALYMVFYSNMVFRKVIIEISSIEYVVIEIYVVNCNYGVSSYNYISDISLQKKMPPFSADSFLTLERSTRFRIGPEIDSPDVRGQFISNGPSFHRPIVANNSPDSFFARDNVRFLPV